MTLAATRPDPVTWTMRILFSSDDTVAALTAPAELGAPLNVLLVVSDSRADVGSLEGRFGDLTESRADVILLVRVGADALRVVHIPRDLKIPSEERGVVAVATLLDDGRPGRLIWAVRDHLQVPVHHYAEMGFAGFAELVDAIGGVAWSVPFSLRDHKSGLDIAAGKQTLDGAGALAYLRARNLEEFRDDSWEPLPADDLARIGRQQALIGEIVERAMDRPSEPRRLLGMARRHIETDPTFTAWTALHIGQRIDALAAGDIQWLVLPVTTIDSAGLVSPFPPEHIGGRYWVELDGNAAAPVLSAMREGS